MYGSLVHMCWRAMQQLAMGVRNYLRRRKWATARLLLQSGWDDVESDDCSHSWAAPGRGRGRGRGQDFLLMMLLPLELIDLQCCLGGMISSR